MTELASSLALPASAAASPSTPAPAGHAPALGSLRGALTLLVVWHHAILAYHAFAPPVGPSLQAMPFWRAFPVVDDERWSGALWAAGFNDTFFMALMFLLSGLFAWPSLARKGALAFARDRGLRLLLPFGVYALVLAPLAYVPSYLQTGAAWSLTGFWEQWSALDSWPTGPAWFLSLLVVFDVATLVVFRAFVALRAWRGEHREGVLAGWRRSPVAIFGALLTIAVAMYVPMAQHFGAMRWSTVGPLTFQTSRVLLYAGFFAAGLVLGARGLGATALVPGGALARRFWLWMLLGAAAFAGNVLAISRVLATMGQSPGAVRLADFAYAGACAAISFAALALALRLGQAPPSAPAEQRGAWASLRRNAYGIYLLHYPAVSWLQYALLDAELSGLAKSLSVCALAIALCWAATAALRRVPPIARVI